jgi:calcineurin-like phosphoesterase family protein
MIYLISDTHLNHANMIDFCGRPADFEKIILKNLKNLKSTDRLIHLGDICMGKDELMHQKLNESCMAKRILIKGNHDKKSYSYYMDRGWNFVCSSLTMSAYGREITFSHKPIPTENVNIYGHFHTSHNSTCEQELINILTPHHWQFCLEFTEYQPVPLEKFIEYCSVTKKTSHGRIIYKNA